jgi:hypothetical protein
LISIPSSGPHCEEIITLDSANTLLTMGKYKGKKEIRDNINEENNTIVKKVNFLLEN